MLNVNVHIFSVIRVCIHGIFYKEIITEFVLYIYYINYEFVTVSYLDIEIAIISIRRIRR
jgi:hypothetical protein